MGHRDSELIFKEFNAHLNIYLLYSSETGEQTTETKKQKSKINDLTRHKLLPRKSFEIKHT